ncbi:MAG: hypothetical protein A2010_01780 [Nitrospirae bacterium GWD2_57_9]|nr:MAG: hypothetical protein A2010_01780 [Nitrospirae bacterium GWD2_57_9]OGW49185.1 MAG: hypothetical protein A2078_13345 [Nitrospirae bacterium GWC2_57_9]
MKQHRDGRFSARWETRPNGAVLPGSYAESVLYFFERGKGKVAKWPKFGVMSSEFGKTAKCETEQGKPGARSAT